MERLTEKFADHYLYSDYAKENCVEKSDAEWKNVQQLGKYEDTDLTPQEVEQMKAENEQYKQKLADGMLGYIKCKECGNEFKLYENSVDKYICPFCMTNNRPKETEENNG